LLEDIDDLVQNSSNLINNPFNEDTERSDKTHSINYEFWNDAEFESKDANSTDNNGIASKPKKRRRNDLNIVQVCLTTESGLTHRYKCPLVSWE